MAHANQAYSDSSRNGIEYNVNGNGYNAHRRALNSLSPTFYIQPKTTGLVSLFIQTVILIISASISIFFFYHVGGYEYTHWNENSTILEPIRHSENSKPVEIPANPNDGSDSLVSTVKRRLNFMEVPYLYNESSDAETVALFINSVSGPDIFIENASFGIEQVPLTTVIIGDIVFDWLEVIRISTLVYIVILAIWFTTGMLFILTIRCEILDTVILNTTVLILVVLFQLAHAGLVTSLMFFQREMSWKTLTITIGTIVILVCCAFLAFVCISLNCGWVKYIDYMHGKKKCSICSMCILCSDRSDDRRTVNAQNEGVPVNPRAYENDVPLDRFDAF